EGGGRRVAVGVEIGGSGIPVPRHQGLDLAVDLVPVLRHTDVFRHGEQLAYPAGGARRGGKFVGRVGLDNDHVSGLACQRQVIGDGGADHSAANNCDLRHFLLGGVSPRVVPASGEPTIA